MSRASPSEVKALVKNTFELLVQASQPCASKWSTKDANRLLEWAAVCDSVLSVGSQQDPVVAEAAAQQLTEELHLYPVLRFLFLFAP